MKDFPLPMVAVLRSTEENFLDKMKLFVLRQFFSREAFVV
jgi:hypothetical protein